MNTLQQIAVEAKAKDTNKTSEGQRKQHQKRTGNERVVEENRPRGEGKPGGVRLSPSPPLRIQNKKRKSSLSAQTVKIDRNKGVKPRKGVYPYENRETNQKKLQDVQQKET